jgi:predicted ATP-dependent endonuclease of OLD family
MIEKLTIRNFKRYESVTFEIPHHVVLAGPNNCGKTTALQAIMAWTLALERWKRLNDFQQRLRFHDRRSTLCHYAATMRCGTDGITWEQSRSK